MNSSVATGLVRGWVKVYTIGLPAEVRFARRDEIESDLWCQQEDAGAIKRSELALAFEILARLVLGSAADLAWRLERRRPAGGSIERSTNMSTRVVALLAIVGGLGLGLVVADWAITDLGSSGTHPWEHRGWTVTVFIGVAGLVALGLSLAWLGLVLLTRLESAVGLVAVVGAAAAWVAPAGAPGALTVFPLSSAVVVLYLARIHAVHWPLALIHAASAPGLLLAVSAYSNPGLIGIGAILTLIYCMTWIAIGLELLRGLPEARPAAPSAS